MNKLSKVLKNKADHGSHLTIVFHPSPLFYAIYVLWGLD
jgi:hypothetical protein